MGRKLPISAIDRRYGRKFALLLLVIFLVTGVAGASIYTTVDDRIDSETEERLTSTASGEADQLDNWFDLTEQQLYSVSRTPAVRSNNAYGVTTRLVRISERDAVAGTHLVNTSSGTVSVSTGDALVVAEDDELRPDVSSRLTRSVTNSPRTITYTEPVRAADESPVMLVATKTPSRDGRVVVAVIDLERLSGQVLGEGGQTGADQTLTVTNESGVVTLSDDTSQILTRVPGGDQSTDSEAGFYTESTNEETAVGYAAVSNRPWTVTNRVPTEQAFALKRAVSDQILLLLGVLFVGLTVVGSTIGRNTVTTLSDLTEKAERLRDGDLDASIETSRRDEFGTVYAALDEMRRSLEGKVTELEAERSRVESAKERAEAARVDAETAREEATALADRLERRAEVFGRVMERAADGDLTQRLDGDLENEAMADIADAFNDMVARLERTAGEIQAVTTDVDAASDHVASGAAEIEDASAQVSHSIDDIFAAASEQNEGLERVADEMADLSATVEEIATTSDDVADLSRRAADRGERGRDLANQSMSRMRAIDRKTDQAVDEIEALDDEVERIGEITVVIEEIAEQTNLLALNASIEAAHADASTDGFAVVADEMKRLVGEVRDATEDIESIVHDVQSSADDAATEMREMRTFVDEGAETIEDGMNELEDIVDLVEEADRGVQSISEATDEQATSAQRVVEMVEDVTELSERTRADAGDVSAAAEEQTAAVASIAEHAHSLTENAARLQVTVDGFDVGDDIEFRRDEPSSGAAVTHNGHQADADAVAATVGQKTESELAPSGGPAGADSTEPALPGVGGGGPRRSDSDESPTE